MATEIEVVMNDLDESESSTGTDGLKAEKGRY
jgi:hypothetical protein